MQDTFIHIGFPKTGSTYIQSQIFAKLEEFHYLTPPFTQHDEQWNRLQYGDDTQFDISAFQNNIDSIELMNKKLLISDEGLVGKPIYGGLHRTIICKRLKQSFPEAKILIIIRGQFEMLKSLHNQWIKGARKGTKTFGDFIWFKKREFDSNEPFSLSNMYFNSNEDYVHLDYLKYWEIIELYKRNFEYVKVLPYELMKSDDRTYLNEIAEFLETDIDHSLIDKSQKNISLSKSELARKIIENSLSNLPISSFEKRVIIERCTSSILKKNFQEYDINSDLIQTYYKSNNLAVVKSYPEIGIQNFPSSY